MKNNEISCEIIKDLIPLYNDKCCSEQTENLVKKHLEECSGCAEIYGKYQEELPVMSISDKEEIKGIKKGIKGIKRWKKRGIILGIVALTLAVTLLFAVIPIYNHIAGSGLSYSNLKPAYIAYSFMKALESENYEKAYEYLDIELKYEELLMTSRIEALSDEAAEKEVAEATAVDAGVKQIEENGYNWYNQVCKKKFMENMKKLTQSKERISSFNDFEIEEQEWGWSVSFDAKTHSDTELIIGMEVSPGGIDNFHSSVVKLKNATKETREQKAKELDRLYRSPSINETVMEILYGNTDFDWTRLFS